MLAKRPSMRCTIFLILEVLLFSGYNCLFAATWQKYTHNPLLTTGGPFEWDGKDVYDASVVYAGGKYKMWYSGREGAHNSVIESLIGILRFFQRYKGLHNRIGYAESSDGIHWIKYAENPVLGPGKDEKWDSENVDRPSVVYKDQTYYMWFTGWSRDGISSIGYAFSKDGMHWKKLNEPVLVATAKWEKKNLMCPNVIYDAQEGQFKMWYSGGEPREPDSIGYAVSSDGIRWHKHSPFPIFTAKKGDWDGQKVGSFQVIKIRETYYAFYNAFDSTMKSRIGSAKSLNGINNWIRYPMNPILTTGQDGSWDCSNVYKPAAVLYGNELRIYYNAANQEKKEQIGLALTDTFEW